MYILVAWPYFLYLCLMARIAWDRIICFSAVRLSMYEFLRITVMYVCEYVNVLVYACISMNTPKCGCRYELGILDHSWLCVVEVGSLAEPGAWHYGELSANHLVLRIRSLLPRQRLVKLGYHVYRDFYVSSGYPVSAPQML